MISTELILWFLSFLFIGEVIFILSRIFPHFLWSLLDGGWVGAKILSFLISALFISIQMIVVFGGSSGDKPKLIHGHYINLLYELLVILGIALLFGLNKLLVNKLERTNERKI